MILTGSRQRRANSFWSTILVGAALGLCYLTIVHHQRQAHSYSTDPVLHAHDLDSFWLRFAHALIEAKPDVPAVGKTGDGTAIYATLNGFDGVTEDYDYRPDLIHFNERELDAMKAAYDLILQDIKLLAPDVPFESGTKGIVTTAAGKYFPPLIVALRMLRRTGSMLPVEVFIESREEYEAEVCEGILPSLNARCVILSETIESAGLEVKIKQYQLKPFAMLFSTFEEILLLDSDCFPVVKPEYLLSTEPYISKGLVTWPDYWANTASPVFYDIINHAVPSPKTRASSESGQVLLNKKTHAATLLLLTYFNFYGYDYYYPLLTQGVAGQGDKETYLAAAMALNASFYAVGGAMDTLGYRRGDDFHGLAIIQNHPNWDYRSETAVLTNEKHEIDRVRSKIAFVHASTVKLNAAQVSEKWQKEIGMRLWGPKEGIQVRFGGRDLEEEAWAEMVYSGCELGDKFKDWESQNGTIICEDMKAIYDELFG